MPLPDLTGYNTLTLFDIDASDLVDRAIIDAAVKMPDWVPGDGGPAIVLMEALALVGQEFVFAVNRLPDSTVLTLGRLLGIDYEPGAPPTSTVTFALSDALGHLIPAGTSVRLTTATGVVDFVTATDLTVAAGDTTGTVGARGESLTSSVNGVPTGTSLAMVSSLGFIDSAELASDIAGGVDPESDTEWRDRLIQRFTRLNDTLVQPDNFTVEALSYPQVVRATSINDNNGTGTAAGHIATAVLGAAGALLSSGDKALVESALADKALINLTPHVIDPTITPVDVTAVAHLLPGQDSSAVQAAVEGALISYLSPETWPWGTTVRLNKLIQVIENVAGVDYATISDPTGDTTLPGVAPLPTIGVLDITAS